MCSAADCRKILRGYGNNKRLLSVWKVERRRLLEELRVVSLPSAPRTDVPSAHGDASSAVERAVLRREKYQARLDELDDMEHEIRLSMEIVENALGAVPETEKRILRQHYIDGIAWYAIADEIGYSYDATRQRASRAMRMIARALP